MASRFFGGLVSCMVVLAAAANANAQGITDEMVWDGTLNCSAPETVTRFTVRLPNTARAIRNGQDLSIVAIGSSSTEGVGATDRSSTYPAQFAAALKRRWANLNIRVVNKGVGGEDARQMLARFEKDVLPHKPHLVIWQVGSNYALRNDDLDAYTAILRKGVNRLKSAHTDVILMDLQYAPRVLEKAVHRRVIETMGILANDLGVALFRRFAIMRHWLSGGRYDFEDIVSRDRLHMNNGSYECIGRLLADSVSAAARAVLPSPADGAAAARNGPIPLQTSMQEMLR